MITREQYMQNSSELHHAYYLQFATESTFQFVRSQIGLEKLKTSKDKYFNDIIRLPGTANATWIWDRAPINQTLCREIGENLSRSTFTCVSKAAARELLNREIVADRKAGQ